MADLPVSIISPAQSVAFRQSRLGRHKTDRADAQLLARFAEQHHAELRRAEPQEPDLARLRQLVGYRDDLVSQQTATRNRQHAAEWAGSTAVVAWLAEDLAQLRDRLQQVETEIRSVLKTIPETAVLTAQIGIGTMTAAAVLAYLPAGVHGNPKAAAAYAGVHPRQAQSGQRARSRLSKQGCPALRRYLYLAAMSAVRCDPELRAWYRALCARGKAPQSALCAVAHKRLRRMMGRLRQARALQDQTLPLAA